MFSRINVYTVCMSDPAQRLLLAYIPGSQRVPREQGQGALNGIPVLDLADSDEVPHGLAAIPAIHNDG